MGRRGDKETGRLGDGETENGGRGTRRRKMEDGRQETEDGKV